MSSAAQPPPIPITADYISGLSGQSKTNTQLNAACASPTLSRRHRRSSNPFAFVRSQKSPIGQVTAPASDPAQKQQWNEYPQLHALSNQAWQHTPLGDIHELPHDGASNHLPELSPQTASSQGAQSRFYDVPELSPQTLSLQSVQSRQSSASSPWGSWGSASLGLSSATTQSSGFVGFTNPPYLCESPLELPCESEHHSTGSRADRTLGFDCPLHAAPDGEAKCRYHPRTARKGLQNMNSVR